MKLRILNIALFVFLLGGITNAQIKAPDTPGPSVSSDTDDEEGGFDKRKLFTGGGFGLSFGSTTYIECSPTLGYKVTERLWPG
ncbi:MAG: hypothetical protein ACPGLV_11525, partial [Bacteroidia bacterium]